MVQCPACGEEERLRPRATLDDGRRETICEACLHEWLRDPAPEWRPPPPVFGTPRQAPFEPFAKIETIPIWRLDRDSIRQRAIARAQTYRDWGHVAGWDSLLIWNEMGIRGEDAVAWYLRKLGHEVKSIADDWIGTDLPDLGDLNVVAARDSRGGGESWNVEVKTDSSLKFRARGPRRFDRSRAAVAVWCTSLSGDRAQCVHIQGWAPIAASGEPEPIRPIHDLDAWLRQPDGET